MTAHLDGNRGELIEVLPIGSRLLSAAELPDRHAASGAIGATREPRTGRADHPVTVVIVDKSAVFRAGLIHVLGKTPFRVVADGPSLAELALEQVDDPCVLLLGLDALAANLLREVSRVRQEHRDLHIVTFSDRFTQQELIAAIEAGCDCCLLRNEISPDVLIKALELALLGGVVLSRGLLQRSIEPATQQPPATRVLEPVEPIRAPSHTVAIPESPMEVAGIVLSNREGAILLSLMRGDSNKHIARGLNIAEATVKVHVKNLLRKIRVKNRTQAAMWGTANRGATVSLS